MIHEPARVLRVAGDRAWVQCASQAGCQRCAEGKGCGGGLFTALLGTRLREIQVDNRAGARVGDRVLLALDERVILASALAAYGLPLLGLLCAGGIAAGLGGQDGLVALAAACGFAFGLLGGRWWSRRPGHRQRFAPVVLEASSARDSCPFAGPPMA